ncbi:TolC family outer membrane protein [Pelagibacterium montanilacus]|uniref:TolC family outer membrane protein n=1 Tax=Pelagibacterium montanilacus TaxID=2185280 RepID=UPI000F8EAB68|nr:TolC family outer membrane protein [Pelagibacterium montanilacus]
MSFFRVSCVGAMSLALLLPTASVQAQSLTEALANAYNNSTDISSAFLTVRSAGQGIRAAEGQILPTISGQAGVSGNWTDSPQPGGDEFSTSQQFGLSYNQTLFDSFATGAAIRAAQAQYDAAIYSVANTEQNVLLSTATAYFEVIQDRRIVEIRREDIGFVRAQLQSARDRLELGEGTRLDVAQAEATLAQSEASYQAAISNLRISEANYQRWVGGEPRSLSGGLRVGHLLPGSVDAALAVAVIEHPGLLASQAQIRAAQFEAEETRASFGPTVSISGGANLNRGDSGSTSASANFGLNLSIPIYTPTRSPAIEQANIGRMQSELDAFSTRDQIIEAVRQAWAGLQSASAQIESATAAVAASRLALEATVDRADLGEGTTLDTLDARATLLSVEEGLVQAQAQRSIASYSLLAAMGRLTALDLQLPVTPRTAEGVAIAEKVPAAAPAAPRDAWGNLR